ncbi:MAG: asparagine--tRNA ligase [Planctomycetes bacterium]|nr:asparagine--tRNA ligase [Planctomycetota bacterium]
MKNDTGKKVVAIKDLGKHEGEEVMLQGWLYNKRGKGKLIFLILRDGSGYVQCVAFKNDLSEEAFADAKSLNQEASIEITGNVKADERAPGGYEINVTDLKVFQNPTEQYPLAIAENVPNIDKLLDIRHLWMRSKKPAAILKIRHEILQALRDFLYKNDFICVDSPMFQPTAAEGTSTLFDIPYFDLGNAYLSQSGQLYVEAPCHVFKKVYTFGPCFRAEKSYTRRHLTEFWMLEPEIAFADLNDVMDSTEALISYTVEYVLEKCAKELEILEREVSILEKIKAPFPRISYHQACEQIIEKRKELIESEDEELRKIGKNAMTEAGDDFGAADETVLGIIYDKPVMVHSYPWKIKAFYMKRVADNPELAACVDVIAPEGFGEIVGGSEREDDIEQLLQNMKLHDLPTKPYEWYLDLRKFGAVPHGGYGLGLERFIAWITGTHHVRECSAFPRTIKRLNP